MDLSDQLQRYDAALGSLPTTTHPLQINRADPPRQLDWTALADIGVDVLSQDQTMADVRFMLTRVDDQGEYLFARSLTGFPGYRLLHLAQIGRSYEEIKRSKEGCWLDLLVPMFCDDQDNYLVIDLWPGSSTRGWLFAYDPETERFTAVASSLTGLVASTAQLIEQGLLTVDPYGQFSFADKIQHGPYGTLLLPTAPDHLYPSDPTLGYAFPLITAEAVANASVSETTGAAPESPSESVFDDEFYESLFAENPDQDQEAEERAAAFGHIQATPDLATIIDEFFGGIFEEADDAATKGQASAPEPAPLQMSDVSDTLDKFFNGLFGNIATSKDEAGSKETDPNDHFAGLDDIDVSEDEASTDATTLPDMLTGALRLLRWVGRAAQEGIDAAKKAWDDEQRRG